MRHAFDRCGETWGRAAGVEAEQGHDPVDVDEQEWREARHGR
jgi:hypothetical protein